MMSRKFDGDASAGIWYQSLSGAPANAIIAERQSPFRVLRKWGSGLRECASLSDWTKPTNPAVEERVEILTERFQRHFGSTPRVYRAPGRVNLIGEHTDYNDGFVMPAAIGFYTWIGVAPRPDRKLVIRSQNFAEQVEFDLNNLPAHGNGHWSDYAAGVTRMLTDSGKRLAGADLLADGDVPHGAGLSSSASFEVAVASALLEAAGEELDRKSLALLCQKAENEFVGARCGIMDQFVSSHGKREHALLLDCRSLEYRLLHLRENVRLVICNTMVRHNLAKGEYNDRRAECEAGARYFAGIAPNVRALRDVSPEVFQAHQHELPDKVMRRCRHVVGENARVLQAGQALERGDLNQFGTLMRQSHQSLRDDFEVSCSELDLMVELAENVDGVYGARMTGGGFGGCTINLVEANSVAEFQGIVSDGYESRTGVKPEIYVCSASDGVGRAS
jgi:galactokinase